MVQFCCVVGCGNRSNRDSKRFYRLPNVPKKCDKLSFKADIIMNRRKQWLMNINREDLKDGDEAYSPGYIRVCSDHFVSGKPSSWSDVENIDWAPTVLMDYDPKLRRRLLNESELGIHQNRGRVHKSTASRRRLKVQELKRKQKLLQLLSGESDSDHCEKGLTECPIIHKITVDCIVKQESGDNRNEFEITELTSNTENETEAVSKVKAEK